MSRTYLKELRDLNNKGELVSMLPVSKPIDPEVRKHKHKHKAQHGESAQDEESAKTKAEIRAELGEKSNEELRELAKKEGATDEDLAAVDEAAGKKGGNHRTNTMKKATIDLIERLRDEAALRKELGGMSASELKERAQSMGAAEEDLDAAGKAGDLRKVKAATIDIILKLNKESQMKAAAGEWQKPKIPYCCRPAKAPLGDPKVPCAGFAVSRGCMAEQLGHFMFNKETQKIAKRFADSDQNFFCCKMDMDCPDGGRTGTIEVPFKEITVPPEHKASSGPLQPVSTADVIENDDKCKPIECLIWQPTQSSEGLGLTTRSAWNTKRHTRENLMSTTADEVWKGRAA